MASIPAHLMKLLLRAGVNANVEVITQPISDITSVRVVSDCRKRPPQRLSGENRR